MYEYEEDSDIIGLSCTLLNPIKVTWKAQSWATMAIP